MGFECVHCGTMITDDSLHVPRSGALCPVCKKDPTDGWSPYLPEVAKEGRRVADEMRLRLMVYNWDVQEAALFFLEDLMLEQRHLLSIRLGGRPEGERRCGVCGSKTPAGQGFQLEIVDRWRSTHISICLCERHANEGLWGNDLDIHANHPDPYLTRGDWNYPTSGRESAGH